MAEADASFGAANVLEWRGCLDRVLLIGVSADEVVMNALVRRSERLSQAERDPRLMFRRADLVERPFGAPQLIVVVCSPRAAQSRALAHRLYELGETYGRDAFVLVNAAGRPLSGAGEESVPNTLLYDFDGSKRLAAAPCPPILADWRIKEQRKSAFGDILRRSGLTPPARDKGFSHRRILRLTNVYGGWSVAVAAVIFLAHTSLDLAGDETVSRASDVSRGSDGDFAGAPVVSASWRENGRSALSNGDFIGAAAIFENARASFARRSAADPDDVDALYDYAHSEFWLGEVAYKLGDLESARRRWSAYRDLAVRLSQADDALGEHRIERAHAELNLGVLDWESGRYRQARDVFEVSLAHFKVGLEDGSAGLGDVANAQGWLSDAYAWLGETDKALAVRADEQALWAERYVRTGSLDDFRRLAEAERFRGQLFMMKGEWGRARSLFRSAGSRAESILEDDPTDRKARRLTVLAARDAAETALASRDYALAAAAFELARGTGEHHLTSDLDRERVAQQAWLAKFEAKLHLLKGDPAKAFAAARLAVDTYETMVSEGRARSEHSYLHALSILAEAERELGHGAAAARTATLILERMPENDAQSLFLREIHARALWFAGRRDEARAIVADLKTRDFRPDRLAWWRERPLLAGDFRDGEGG